MLPEYTLWLIGWVVMTGLVAMVAARVAAAVLAPAGATAVIATAPIVPSTVSAAPHSLDQETNERPTMANPHQLMDQQQLNT